MQPYQKVRRGKYNHWMFCMLVKKNVQPLPYLPTTHSHFLCDNEPWQEIRQFKYPIKEQESLSFEIDFPQTNF